VVIIATGQTKSLAVKKCIEDGTNHMWTASCLQNHPCAMFVVDDDATLELQVKTVKVCTLFYTKATLADTHFPALQTCRDSRK